MCLAELRQRVRPPATDRDSVLVGIAYHCRRVRILEARKEDSTMDRVPPDQGEYGRSSRVRAQALREVC